MRDPVLEATLQEALDAGHAVWAIGDVHGFDEPLDRLLDALELCEGIMWSSWGTSSTAGLIPPRSWQGCGRHRTSMRSSGTTNSGW